MIKKTISIAAFFLVIFVIAISIAKANTPENQPYAATPNAFLENPFGKHFTKPMTPRPTFTEPAKKEQPAATWKKGQKEYPVATWKKEQPATWERDQPVAAWKREQPASAWKKGQREQPVAAWKKEQPMSAWKREQPVAAWKREQPVTTWEKEQPVAAWKKEQPANPENVPASLFFTA